MGRLSLLSKGQNSKETASKALLVFPSISCYYINVRIFKNKWFHRFADKEGITDGELKEVVKQLESGQFYADLGGSVYKMELARKGEGKHGGYRVLVFFKFEERVFFHYGFPKSVLGNISQKELKIIKKQAKASFVQSDEHIEKQLANGTLYEII